MTKNYNYNKNDRNDGYNNKERNRAPQNRDNRQPRDNAADAKAAMELFTEAFASLGQKIEFVQTRTVTDAKNDRELTLYAGRADNPGGRFAYVPTLVNEVSEGKLAHLYRTVSRDNRSHKEKVQYLADRISEKLRFPAAELAFKSQCTRMLLADAKPLVIEMEEAVTKSIAKGEATLLVESAKRSLSPAKFRELQESAKEELAEIHQQVDDVLTESESVES